MLYIFTIFIIQILDYWSKLLFIIAFLLVFISVCSNKGHILVQIISTKYFLTMRQLHKLSHQQCDHLKKLLIQQSAIQ